MPLAEAKQLDMPAVTGVMLEELEARIADGFGHDLPVPFYSMPRGRFRASCCYERRSSALTLALERLGSARKSKHRGLPWRKATTIKVKLVSSADTGFYYVTQEELAHHDRQAGEEEIRSGRQEARRVPRSPRSSKSAARHRGTRGRPLRAPFARVRCYSSWKASRPLEMKVAGRERCHEEATRTAPEPAEPHGPRRCGGPEHSVGLSKR